MGCMFVNAFVSHITRLGYSTWSYRLE